MIVAAISDPDDGVRLEAIRALKMVSPTPTHVAALRPLLEPGSRLDPSIRDEAWSALQLALPSLTKEQLEIWADHFKGDPLRQIVVRKTLLDQLVAAKDLDAAATTQQQIADSYMELNPPDAESAVPYYRAALEYRQANRGGGPVLAQLVDSNMKALLRSGKYDEAIAFASEMLTKDAGMQRSMGAAIRDAAEQLVASQRPDDLYKAQQLIDKALGMSPPLAEQYLDGLRDVRRKVDQRLAEQGPPPTTGPRSAASEPTPPATRATVEVGG
jgi:tetratricopeptide (TPR) repeat protein